MSQHVAFCSACDRPVPVKPEPLATYPFEKLCPGKETLEELIETYR
jgi:hypothetical protein